MIVCPAQFRMHPVAARNGVIGPIPFRPAKHYALSIGQNTSAKPVCSFCAISTPMFRRLQRFWFKASLVAPFCHHERFPTQPGDPVLHHAHTVILETFHHGR